MSLVDGVDPKNMILNEIATGVVLSIPDYPYSHLTRKEVVGIPVYGQEQVMEHIHPCEMMECEVPAEEGGRRKCLGTAGDYVLVMTATGQTVRETQRTVYRHLKIVNVTNTPLGRTHRGDPPRKELPVLQKHGYATGMSYQPIPASSTASPTRPSTPSKDVSM